MKLIKTVLAFITLMVFTSGCSVPMTTIKMSASAKNPPSKTRLVSTPTGVDTVTNPMDYELAMGAIRKKGGSSAEIWIWTERQGGITSTSYEHHLSQQIATVRGGWDFVNRNESPASYASSFYLEKVYGVIGIGVTRTYAEEWFGDGAWMARSSLKYSERVVPVDSLPLDIVTTASYSFNKSASNLSMEMNVQGLKKGPVSLVPMFRLNQTRPTGGDPITNYQAKLSLIVTLSK